MGLEKLLKGSREHYEKFVVPELKKKFSFKSVMSIPRLEKIVLNMGVGQAKISKTILAEGQKKLTLIGGQKAVLTKAKKSIAGFKIREDMLIGVKATLRKEKMYDFLIRLVHINIPRIKDFHGISRKAFDGRGNYSLGIKDSGVFVEVSHLHSVDVIGMSVQFVSSASNDDEAFALLESMGLCFRH